MKGNIYFGCFIACALISGGCSDQKSADQIQHGVQQEVQEMKISKWEPKSTVVGQGFNVQANGDSALIFEATPIGGANTYEMWMGNTKLDGVAIVQNKGGSVQVPKALIDKPGKYPLSIVVLPEGKKIELGVFEVLPKQ